MIDTRDILTALHERHACKEFDPERRIPAEEFDLLLETARLSPTSFGFEPWQLVVIQDPALRERLLPVTWGARKQLPTASHYLAFLVRKAGMRFDAEHVRHMMQDIQKLPAERQEMKTAVYRKFQEMDFALLDSDRALFDWGCKQAYIALGNMMTVAALRGIDSCPIEGFEMAGAERILSEAGVLDSDAFGLAVMVAFGYRKNPRSEKTRRPLPEVVRWVG